MRRCEFADPHSDFASAHSPCPFSTVLLRRPRRFRLSACRRRRPFRRPSPSSPWPSPRCWHKLADLALPYPYRSQPRSSLDHDLRHSFVFSTPEHARTLAIPIDGALTLQRSISPLAFFPRILLLLVVLRSIRDVPFLYLRPYARPRISHQCRFDQSLARKGARAPPRWLGATFASTDAAWSRVFVHLHGF